MKKKKKVMGTGREIGEVNACMGIGKRDGKKHGRKKRRVTIRRLSEEVIQMKREETQEREERMGKGNAGIREGETVGEKNEWGRDWTAGEARVGRSEEGRGSYKSQGKPGEGEGKGGTEMADMETGRREGKKMRKKGEEEGIRGKE